VRIPNPRLIRLASTVNGAIIEPGDSELIVSPLLQPTIDLSSPVDKAISSVTLGSAAAPENDSFYVEASSLATGVQASNFFDMVFMSRGLWRFECWVSWHFIGTSQQATNGLFLVDPDGIIANFASFGMQTGVMFSSTRDVTLCFQRDGWKFQFRRQVMVGGDIAHLLASVNGRRLV
jgi:hypothetical protein